MLDRVRSEELPELTQKAKIEKKTGIKLGIFFFFFFFCLFFFCGSYIYLGKRGDRMIKDESIVYAFLLV